MNVYALIVSVLYQFQGTKPNKTCPKLFPAYFIFYLEIFWVLENQWRVLLEVYSGALDGLIWFEAQQFWILYGFWLISFHNDRGFLVKLLSKMTVIMVSVSLSLFKEINLFKERKILLRSLMQNYSVTCI